MGFKPGPDPKRAKGRPKGSLNKATTLSEQLIEAGFSEEKVVLGVCDIARDPSHPRHYDALRDLLDRIHAKKKQVDVAIDPEKNKLEIIIRDYGTKA